MDKTYVSQLQEILQKMGERCPEYVIDKCTDGSKFVAVCYIQLNNTTKLVVKGFGYGKMEAKHDSAKNAIMQLRQTIKCLEPMELNNPKNSILTPNNTKVSPVTYNAVGQLNELSQRKNLRVIFSKTDYLPFEIDGVNVYLYQIKCTVGSLEATGRGHDKKSCKQSAADEMLQMLNKEENNLASQQNGRKLPSDEEVIRMYTRLSISSKSAPTVTNNTEKSFVFHTQGHLISEGLHTSEQMKDAFAEHLPNIHYEVKVFQKDPLILKFSVKDTYFVFLQLKQPDDTYESLLLKLLKTSFNMVYSMKDVLNPGHNFVF